MPDILMATYNGARHVAQQIDSILAQSCRDWRLLVRDDGSADDTARICRTYAERHPSRISFLEDRLGRLGPTGNFNHLLSCSDGQHIMFCDQDDVWLPHKVEKTLSAMRLLEQEFGIATPALVYTDSKVANQDLEVMSPSLVKYLHRRTCVTPNGLCVESPVYGNTMMINHALKQTVGSLPEGIVAHDWWFALGAAVFGKVRFVNESTVLWRRHGGAVSGARRHGLQNYLSKSLAGHRTHIHKALRQSTLFCETFGDRLNSDQKSLFAAASRISRGNWVMRRYLIIRHRLFKTGFLKNAGLLLAV